MKDWKDWTWIDVLGIVIGAFIAAVIIVAIKAVF